MALINCITCNQEISDETRSCPHCGARTQKGKKLQKRMFIGLGIGAVILIITVAIIFVFEIGAKRDPIYIEKFENVLEEHNYDVTISDVIDLEKGQEAGACGSSEDNQIYFIYIQYQSDALAIDSYTEIMDSVKTTDKNDADITEKHSNNYGKITVASNDPYTYSVIYRVGNDFLIAYNLDDSKENIASFNSILREFGY